MNKYETSITDYKNLFLKRNLPDELCKSETGEEENNNEASNFDEEEMYKEKLQQLIHTDEPNYIIGILDTISNMVYERHSAVLYFLSNNIFSIFNNLIKNSNVEIYEVSLIECIISFIRSSEDVDLHTYLSNDLIVFILNNININNYNLSLLKKSLEFVCCLLYKEQNYKKIFDENNCFFNVFELMNRLNENNNIVEIGYLKKTILQVLVCFLYGDISWLSKSNKRMLYIFIVNSFDNVDIFNNSIILECLSYLISFEKGMFFESSYSIDYSVLLFKCLHLNDLCCIYNSLYIIDIISTMKTEYFDSLSLFSELMLLYDFSGINSDIYDLIMHIFITYTEEQNYHEQILECNIINKCVSQIKICPFSYKIMIGKFIGTFLLFSKTDYIIIVYKVIRDILPELFDILDTEERCTQDLLSGFANVLDATSICDDFQDIKEEILEGIKVEKLLEYSNHSNCEITSTSKYILDKYYFKE